jgi:hypothetical protein
MFSRPGASRGFSFHALFAVLDLQQPPECLKAHHLILVLKQTHAAQNGLIALLTGASSFPWFYLALHKLSRFVLGYEGFLLAFAAYGHVSFPGNLYFPTGDLTMQAKYATYVAC